MSESLRNDGRIWVPKKLEDAKKLQEGTLQGKDIPEEDRDYYLERRLIRHSVTSFRVTLPAALPKNAATRASA